MLFAKNQNEHISEKEGGAGSVSSHLTTASRAGQTHQPLADLTHTQLEDGQTSASETQTREEGGEGPNPFLLISLWNRT